MGRESKMSCCLNLAMKNVLIIIIVIGRVRDIIITTIIIMIKIINNHDRNYTNNYY